MIIKMDQVVEGLTKFARKTRVIFAKRMTEDFLVETWREWDKGKRGEWLIRVGGQYWAIVANEDFLKVYTKSGAEKLPDKRPDGGVERRTGLGDRRAA